MWRCGSDLSEMQPFLVPSKDAHTTGNGSNAGSSPSLGTMAHQLASSSSLGGVQRGASRDGGSHGVNRPTLAAADSSAIVRNFHTLRDTRAFALSCTHTKRARSKSIQRASFEQHARSERSQTVHSCFPDSVRARLRAFSLHTWLQSKALTYLRMFHGFRMRFLCRRSLLNRSCVFNP